MDLGAEASVVTREERERDRAERRAQALRANLRRRKAPVRADDPDAAEPPSVSGEAETP